jgi:hypothetical protein
VATWDDVRRIAFALPETSERHSRELPWWQVKDRGFVWERPLRRADLEYLGADAPDGPILGSSRRTSTRRRDARRQERPSPPLGRLHWSFTVPGGFAR